MTKFLTILQTEFSDLFEKAVSENYVVCIPNTFKIQELNKFFLSNH